MKRLADNILKMKIRWRMRIRSLWKKMADRALRRRIRRLLFIRGPCG